LLCPEKISGEKWLCDVGWCRRDRREAASRVGSGRLQITSDKDHHQWKDDARSRDDARDGRGRLVADKEHYEPPRGRYSDRLLRTDYDRGQVDDRRRGDRDTDDMIGRGGRYSRDMDSSYVGRDDTFHRQYDDGRANKSSRLDQRDRDDFRYDGRRKDAGSFRSKVLYQRVTVVLDVRYIEV